MRAIEYGWQIPLFNVMYEEMPRDVLRQYALITTNQLMAHVAIYRPNQDSVTQGTQCAQQLHHLLQLSLSENLKARVIARRDEYIHNGHEDGLLMLKIVLALVDVQTRATLAVIQRNLARLSTKMVELDYDIIKFNAHVREMINQLTVRNEVVPSLLAELFAAYKLVPDDEFVGDLRYHNAQWENPNVAAITNEDLLTIAEVKFQTLDQRGEWKAISPKDEHIIALQAQVSKLEGKTAEKGAKKADKIKGKDKTAWAWKTVAPKAGEATRKKFQDKWYIFCPHHQSTKWVLEENHAGGCRNAPGGDGIATPTATVPGAVKKDNEAAKKKLTYAKALLSVMEKDEEDNDSGEESD